MAKEAAPPAPVRVRFLRLWSADVGVFLPGDEADLPEAVAVALSLEFDPTRNEPSPVVELL